MRQRYCKAPTRASSFSRDVIHAHEHHLLPGPFEHVSQSTGELVFWIASALCIVAELAILRAAFAPHAHTDTPAPIPHSPRGTEMVWAVIPAIILGVLLAATWRAIH